MACWPKPASETLILDGVQPLKPACWPELPSETLLLDGIPPERWDLWFYATMRHRGPFKPCTWTVRWRRDDSLLQRDRGSSALSHRALLWGTSLMFVLKLEATHSRSKIDVWIWKKFYQYSLYFLVSRNLNAACEGKAAGSAWAFFLVSLGQQ